MKNIQDLLQYLRTELQTIYETYEANAMAMQVAEHLLQLSQLQLSLQRQNLADAHIWEKAEQIITRLQTHEPLQYVLGIAHFYGLELEVKSAVLIPRPETEELVDIIIKENQTKTNLSILDICTGSGCIAIALAAHLHTNYIYGLDISEPALAVARTNSQKYNQTISWLQQDILLKDISLPTQSLDIIVSNPPYVQEQEKAQMRANVLEYEPHLALFVPDADPLLFYRRIAQISLQLLKPTGSLYFEINEKEGIALVNMLKALGFAGTNTIKDLFSKDRFIKATVEHG